MRSMWNVCEVSDKCLTSPQQVHFPFRQELERMLFNYFDVHQYMPLFLRAAL